MYRKFCACHFRGVPVEKNSGRGRFAVTSAGAEPAGQVHSLTLRGLRERYGIDASDAWAKSWDEFKNVNFDFVITVCDNAKEKCPVWAGAPMIAHWGSPDPAIAAGTEEEKFRVSANVASQIARRVELFCAFSDGQLGNAVNVRGVCTQFPFEAGEVRAKR